MKRRTGDKCSVTKYLYRGPRIDGHWYFTGPQNAVLVEPVAGEIEGHDCPAGQRWDGRGIDSGPAESEAVPETHSYRPAPAEPPASERPPSLRSTHLPLGRGLSAPVAPKPPDLPATAEPQPQTRRLDRPLAGLLRRPQLIPAPRHAHDEDQWEPHRKPFLP